MLRFTTLETLALRIIILYPTRFLLTALFTYTLYAAAS